MEQIRGVNSLVASAASTPRGYALVVDDQLPNRMLLRGMLEREGFEVLEATDGNEAIEIFSREHVDIVFMDVMMPGMDGYEATRQIKALSGDRFIPVIFLTVLADEAALARCIESGGDDFLSKPFSRTILAARVSAMERIATLYRDMSRQREELSAFHEEMLRQHEIAERIFDRAISDRNEVVQRLNTYFSPAATFTGDVLLTACRASGGVDILLGDFTGHGLSAAIGTLPLSEVFHAMTDKELPPSEIIYQINQKLHALLPTGMFLAACYLSISNDLQKLQVWNGGMPDILLIDSQTGQLRERLASHHFPLGITRIDASASEMQEVALQRGDRILLYTDGLLEAVNTAGEAFGDSRLLQVIDQHAQAEGCFDKLVGTMQDFTHGLPQTDDVTIVGIPVVPELLSGDGATPTVHTSAEVVRGKEGEWRWFIELRGKNLGNCDPVMLALRQLREIDGIEPHLQALHMVFSELYNNALEHGVLGLESTQKDSEEGFYGYYEERERRLAELTTGWVWMEVRHVPRAPAGGAVTVRVHDSGPGFDYHRLLHGLH